MAALSTTKVKKIARISAEAAQMMGVRITSTHLDHGRDPAEMARLMQKHLPGVSALSRDFDKLLKRNAIKTEAEVKKLRAEALKGARGRTALLASLSAQRAEALQALPEVIDVASAKRFWLSTPIEIVGSGLNFDSFEATPFKSFAKFKATWTKTGGQFPGAINPAVFFRFVWQNASEKYVVINANGFLVLNGFCDIWSDGGIFGGARAATLEINPSIQLFDWTTEPYLSFGKEDFQAFSIKTNTGGTWDDADNKAIDIFRGYDLTKSLVLVPPNTTVGVEVSAQMNVYAGRNSGRVRADFSTGNYQVGGPGVLITVLS